MASLTKSVEYGIVTELCQLSSIRFSSTYWHHSLSQTGVMRLTSLGTLGNRHPTIDQCADADAHDSVLQHLGHFHQRLHASDVRVDHDSGRGVCGSCARAHVHGRESRGCDDASHDRSGPGDDGQSGRDLERVHDGLAARDVSVVRDAWECRGALGCGGGLP